MPATVHTVLVLEDEPDLRFLLGQNLAQQGYRVLEAGRVAEARGLVSPEVGLFLFDVMLPDGDGFELLRELRGQGVTTPTVFLTAKTAEPDRLLGFAVGGDDYVTKPFSMAELMARIGAILRRGPLVQETYRGPTFWVDFTRYVLHKGEQEIALTYLESELLRYLVERPGQAVDRLELLNQVWGYDRYPTTRTVDTHVLNLRRKLEPDPKHPVHLLTVHGVGYKFVG
ncbi:MAG: response regulator transcription factor [Planctomycetota bacterium]